MKKTWQTYAPNGIRVFVSTGPYKDEEFKQGQIIEREGLANKYPRIFRPLFREQDFIEQPILVEKDDDRKTDSGKTEHNPSDTDGSTEKESLSSGDGQTGSEDGNRDSDGRQGQGQVTLKSLGMPEDAEELDDKYLKPELIAVAKKLGIEFKKGTKEDLIKKLLE